MAEIGEIRRGRDIGKKKALGSPYYIWQACIDCGKERWVLLRNGSPASYRCRTCSNRLNHTGAERRGDGHGYILVHVDPADFFYSMRSSGNYVLEHRLVMAKYLHRWLNPWEIVHHKNGIKDDNRLQNLVLLPSRQVHMMDSVAKVYIRRLQKKIGRQAKQIKFLQSQLGG